MDGGAAKSFDGMGGGGTEARPDSSASTASGRFRQENTDGDREAIVHGRRIQTGRVIAWLFFSTKSQDVGVRESQPLDRFYASCRTDGRTGQAQASPVHFAAAAAPFDDSHGCHGAALLIFRKATNAQ
jgi:CHASE1-domain containing sensor protein